MTHVVRLTSKTTASRILATSVERAARVSRVIVSRRDTFARLQAGVLRACGERFSETRNLSLPMCTHDPDDLEAALAVGFPRLSSFCGGMQPLTAEALGGLARRESMTDISANIAAIAERLSHGPRVWEAFVSRPKLSLFFLGCDELASESMGLLARTISTKTLVLLGERSPWAMEHVFAMLERCDEITLMCDDVFFPSESERVALRARARPGQLKLVMRDDGMWSS